MSVPLFHPDLPRYLDGLVPSRPAEMMAMEAEAERTDFPIIGPAAGYFCYLITRLIGARSVFGLGSGFGYSTAWFARAVKENGGGTVYHTHCRHPRVHGAGGLRPRVDGQHRADSRRSARRATGYVLFCAPAVTGLASLLTSCFTVFTIASAEMPSKWRNSSPLPLIGILRTASMVTGMGRSASAWSTASPRPPAG